MTKTILVVALAAAACALQSGCGGYQSATYPSPSPAYAAAMETKTLAGRLDITDDPYKGRVEYVTPVAQRGPLTDREIYVLAAHVDKKTGQRRYFLQWSMVYDDIQWRFYQSANTDKGEPLRFVSLDRKVSSCAGSRYGRGCSYSESIDVTFTPAMMQRGMTQGLNLKISSRISKESIVDIPASVIQELMNAVNTGKR